MYDVYAELIRCNAPNTLYYIDWITEEVLIYHTLQDIFHSDETKR